MDPNIPIQPTPPMAPETQTPIIQPVQPTPSSSSNRTKYVLLGLLILLIIAAVGGGTYYLGVVRQQSVVQKNNNVVTSTIKPSSTPVATLTPTSTPSTRLIPTSTPDPTANWKIYSGQGISYQYPESWKTQYNFTNYADTAVYDPNSMHTVVGNGGSQTQQPTVFFDVQKVINTTQTAKSYADEYTSGIPYNQFTATELERQSKLANGIQIELFTAQGEGNIGKYLILSNGVKIAVVNTSLVSLNGEEVENLILSTFKFTQ